MVGPNQDIYGQTYANRIRDQWLCRTYQLPPGAARITGNANDIPGAALRFVQVKGIADFWRDSNTSLAAVTGNLLAGLCADPALFAYVIKGDEQGIEVFFGAEQRHFPLLVTSLYSNYPRLGLADEGQGRPLAAIRASQDFFHSGGVITGYPSPAADPARPNQIDAVIRGMMGQRWLYCLFAHSVGLNLLSQEIESTIQQLTQVGSQLEQSQSRTDAVTNSTQTLVFEENKAYYQHLGQHYQRLERARASGAWDCCRYYAAHSPAAADMLGRLLVAAFSGDESQPEAQRVFPVANMADCILGATLPPNVHACPRSESAAPVSRLAYQNRLSSYDLGIIAAPPARDTAGWQVGVYAPFDVQRAQGTGLSLGRIISDQLPLELDYRLDVNELNRHCLVVGLTGSGKTNTAKNLLWQVSHSQEGLPFLVIEPAKKEYWELYNLGYHDLQVYTVGSSRPEANPLRINPFAFEQGVELQTHIDYLFATFKASFIMYPPMPYVLEKAIYEVYRRVGWDTATSSNPLGRVFPTIDDLYDLIPGVTQSMGYDDRLRNDVIGSLRARINSLRLGAKGRCLNVRDNYSVPLLLQSRAVIEMEDIGDDDTKAFIMGILLVQLLEYRKTQDSSQKRLRHLMLIEEAHRLLKNLPAGSGENADPRGNAVEFFCNMLAETRSKGQGFIIADQIASKLAPDAIKNTNLKIVHRTVAADDRQLLGQAMNMNQQQIDFLSLLRQGEAAVYSEGDDRPKLVKPPYVGLYQPPGQRELTYPEVLRAVGGNCQRGAAASAGGQQEEQDLFCQLCPFRQAGCQEQVYLHYLAHGEDRQSLDQLCQLLSAAVEAQAPAGQLRRIISGFCRQEYRDSLQAAACVFNQLLKDSSYAEHNKSGLAWMMLRDIYQEAGEGQ